MSRVSTEIRTPAPPSDAITPLQLRSGIAAWLGWFFDGMDYNLYSMVATPFVTELLTRTDYLPTKADVTEKSSYIQAAFLIGWAFGGTFFGWLGDRIGRSRALSLTILTYAMFTGLSVFAHAWWHLLIFRFISALGVGGEWAVGSSLISEAWPRKYRAWMAAILQTGVNLGVMVSCVASYAVAHADTKRYLFLIGVLPAILVYWIRKKVPEPVEWATARSKAGDKMPSVLDLFRGSARRITLCAIGVCALSLTAWWAFGLWNLTFVRNMPEMLELAKTKAGAAQVEQYVNIAYFLVIGISIFGNFFGAAVAKLLGYRKAVMVMFAGFFGGFMLTYGIEHEYKTLVACMCVVGFFSGVFGLFTMYLPPLFPTLLRTTGAGFCFNIGRLAAAGGVILFGVLGTKVDFGHALLIDGCLFIPAILVTLFMPDLRDQTPDTHTPDRISEEELTPSIAPVE